MKNNPTLKLLFMAGVTAGLTTFYVLNENSKRDFPSIETVEITTSVVNSEIEKASKKEDLPRLSETWRSIQTIAAIHGVHVVTLEKADDAGITSSDIPYGTPWYGVLQGKTKNVAIAAIEIQKAVPILYGAAALDNHLIGMSFAALGSTSTSNKEAL